MSRSSPAHGVRLSRLLPVRAVRFRSVRLPVAAIALYSKQLAALLRAGVPIVPALRLLQRQRLKAAFEEIVREQILMLEKGQPFSSTLRRWPGVFGPMYVALIVAGERAGVLSSVLERLAQYDAHRVRTRSRMTSAMVYPMVVMMASLCIVWAMLIWVVPQFESMYESMLQGASLPALTRWVVQASRWIESSGWWLLVGVAVGMAVIPGLSAMDAWIRWRDRCLLRIPIWGSLRLHASLARFCRSLSTLLESAVPMLDALDTATATLQNRSLEQRLSWVREQVRDGRSIAHCLEQDPLFPAVLGGMVAVGESTGSLSTMLMEVAQLFETEVDERLERLLTLLEPALILMLAFSIGFLVIALFLPMVELMQRLGV